MTPDDLFARYREPQEYYAGRKVPHVGRLSGAVRTGPDGSGEPSYGSTFLAGVI